LKPLRLRIQQDLIEALVPLLQGMGKDYSSNLIVFPGKRPAHFLRKALAQKIRGSFIPPVILSMDEFVDSVYEHEKSRPKKRLEAIDAVAVLYDLQRRSPRKLGGEGFMTPDAFFPIGLKIYHDIEELSIEKVLPEKLEEVEPLIGAEIPRSPARPFRTSRSFMRNFTDGFRPPVIRPGPSGIGPFPKGWMRPSLIPTGRSSCRVFSPSPARRKTSSKSSLPLKRSASSLKRERDWTRDSQILG
jgi:hypothetical protein